MSATPDGLFHPVWMASKEGGGQIWTASVSVGEDLVARPLPSVSRLEDVSSQVTFAFSNSHYDEVSDTVSVDVGIINQTTAKTALAAPLLMQVIDLHSDFGTIQVQNADNGERGVGATWDLSNLLPGESLAPGATSLRRRLLFHISKPQIPSGRRESDLVIVRGQIFSKTVSTR